MREAAGEPPHGVHLLRLEELRLAAAQGLLGHAAAALAASHAGGGRRDEGDPGRQQRAEQHAAAGLVALPLDLDRLLQAARLVRELEEQAVESLVGPGADPHVLAAGQPFLAAARPLPELGRAAAQPLGLPAQLRVVERLQ